jgi:hypothetical protein
MVLRTGTPNQRFIPLPVWELLSKKFYDGFLIDLAGGTFDISLILVQNYTN